MYYYQVKKAIDQVKNFATKYNITDKHIEKSYFSQANIGSSIYVEVQSEGFVSYKFTFMSADVVLLRIERLVIDYEWDVPEQWIKIWENGKEVQ